MAITVSRKTGRSPALMFALLVMLTTLGGLGTAAALAAAGLVEIPFFMRRSPAREGWVLVPTSGRVISVYALVQRDDLCDVQTGLWSEVWLPKDSLAPDTVLDRTKLFGRVLNHEKATGFAFRETDFMPVGTRFGMVAGIPLGKRSVVVEASKIGGIHALQKGDRFDIVATLRVEKHRSPDSEHSAAALPPAEPEVRVLVTNGAIVMPAHQRSTSTTAPTLLSGPRTTTKSVEEVAIAVEPEEISRLTAAISMNATITCVGRSGHPDEPKTLSVTPGSLPQPEPIAVETVVGGKCKTIYFPNPASVANEQELANVARRNRPGEITPVEYRQELPAGASVSPE